MKIIEVRSDGRGGAIYSKPDPEQEKNILLILEKLKKDGGEKNGNNKWNLIPKNESESESE